MAVLDTPDYETTRQQLAAFAANRAPELGTSPVELLGELVGAEAQQAQSMGAAVARVSADSPPSADSSDAGRRKWSIAYGLSNGAGGYGPRGATMAMGATGYLTGRAGIAFLAGQLAQGPGGVQIQLRAGVTIPGTPPGTGQVLGTWDAVEPGAAGNLPPGVTCTLQSPPGGSDATFVLRPGPIAGQAMAVLGLDEESPGSLLERLQGKMQRPPNGGNPADYAEWTANATDGNGVPLTSSEVVTYRYPNYDGDGSPMLVVTFAGSGLGRIPPPSLLAALPLSVKGTTGVAGKAPITHDVRFLPPYMPTERALTIVTRVVPAKAAYNFDWLCGGTPLQVSAFAGVLLTLTAPAPVSLVNAIRAAAGAPDKGPRIVLHTMSAALPVGEVIPRPVRVVAISVSLLVLTLQEAPPTAPVAGDKVYPGGPLWEIRDGGGIAVGGVPQAINAAVNVLGSSRASGLADPAAPWQDTLALTSISTAAETALDADGVTRLVDHCIAGSTTIAVGSNPAAAADVQATDNTINGPELLYAGRILISD